MNVNTSEPTTELVKRDQLISRRYQVDVKKIMCPLQWWEHDNPCSLLWVFLLTKYKALWDHTYKLKESFLQSIYSLI